MADRRILTDPKELMAGYNHPVLPDTPNRKVMFLFVIILMLFVGTCASKNVPNEIPLGDGTYTSNGEPKKEEQPCE